jgi:hypothetical protein
MKTAKRYGPVLLLALAVMLAPMTASAAISFVTSDVSTLTVFQQTLNNPCVIGDQSCKEPANMDYTAVSGTPGGNNGSSYDLFSPVYQAHTGGVVGVAGPTPDLIPTSFTIGVDQNIAAGANPPNEYLVAFRTYLCTGFSATNQGGTTNPGTGCAPDPGNTYTGAPTAIPNQHNGNGFSDILLTGFSLVSGSYYVFEAVISNDSDGMEEFFIIPSGSPAVTPEPASILMLGTTLIGIGAITRRRLNRKNAQ